MNHLHRPLAPISDEAWSQIEAEATRELRHFLAARRVVDFSGPHGWDHSCLDLGRVTGPHDGPAAGVESRIRLVQPLTELRTPFTVPREEIIDAARRAALAEDRLVFGGFDGAGVRGIVHTSPHDPVTITTDYSLYPNYVARAVETLKRSGVDGPYAIALGPRCYTGVIETTERGGYPVLQHLGLITGGPVVWAPAVDGAVVVSLRGGDFELIVGQDFSIGYLVHDAETVTLYLEESLTFRATGPEAAIALEYERVKPKARARRG